MIVVVSALPLDDGVTPVDGEADAYPRCTRGGGSSDNNRGNGRNRLLLVRGGRNNDNDGRRRGAPILDAPDAVANPP